MKLVKLTILLSILFSLTSLKAQDRDFRLNKLFIELKINNSALTNTTEQKIWEIWSTHPHNKELTKRLAEGSSLVRNKQLSKAINIFTDYKIILLISFILEIFHFIIPNRAFEFYDLTANVLGVLTIILLERLRKWLNY